MPADVRYIRYRAWWMATHHTGEGPPYSYLAENLLETWMPADRATDWLLRRTLTGRRRWLAGDEPKEYSPGWPTGEWRAPYGDFYAKTPAESAPGHWHRPNPAWLADLPRDPGPLLDRLRAALPGNRNGDPRLLRQAAPALTSGQLPADLVVALYRALAGLPGVSAHESVVDLDGRAGTALLAEDEFRAEELIFDRGAGEFLGERTTLTAEVNGVPAGTVTGFTSLRTASVDALGDSPAGAVD